MGDSWGALAVPYLLAKYVFPRMEHVGWTGLHEAALLEKSRPYSLELRANWARLKVAHVREGTGNGRCLKKDRWCDTLLFRAQDACMADSVRVNRAVQRLAVMGFVKVTCSRAGAMARDWADRAGLQVRVCVARWPLMQGDVVGARSAPDWCELPRKQVQWIGRNILSVRDFVWHKDGHMELTEVEMEVRDAVRGEVTINRVKRHYFERNYKYAYSVTPEAIEVARRAATWIAVHFWRRGLFAVQYDGMSPAAVTRALRARRQGYEGGMPAGAVITEEEAIRRWLAGERAYFRGTFGGKVRASHVVSGRGALGACKLRGARW